MICLKKLCSVLLIIFYHFIWTNCAEEKYYGHEPRRPMIKRRYAAYIYSPLGGCGGAVIDERWVITSAHCLVSRDGAKMPAVAITLTAGFSAVYDNAWESVMLYRAAQVFIHERYDRLSGQNDVALIQTNKVLMFGTDSIDPIPVQDKPWSENMLRAKFCMTLEWNRDIYGPNLRHYLTAYNVTIGHAYNVCPCITKKIMTDNLLCLRSRRGCQYCQGSLGGVVICEDQVVGVTNHIIDCRHCDPSVVLSDCEQEYIYRTYTYLCEQRQWMYEKTKLESFKKAVKCQNTLRSQSSKTVFPNVKTIIFAQTFKIAFFVYLFNLL